MNNQTDIGLKFTNKVIGAKDLSNYEKRLKSIKTLMQQVSKGTTVGSGLKEFSQDSEKIDKNLSNAFSTAKFIGFNVGLKKIAQAMTSLVNKSSSYLESINLYQVAFNGAYDEADRFVNKITEMYGLDESWAVQTVGIFRQLANAMGLATEQANSLSTLMTQMSVDISSLYNVDIERASQVLQSALAGQTRPIRSVTGADITMNTLQQTLDQLGIEKAVNQLSFAEKRLLIIISLTQQLSKATNDFGRTIESPANQMRILNEQWQRLTRAIGNVFLPILAKVLPYLNAILMVLTEIISIIAKLFGYKEEDFDYFSGTAESVIDLEEGLNGAAESAKKLKQGLRGFDKLNVITTPSTTSSSVGASGGISPDIAKAYDDAMSGYMKKLDNVQMKATKIRDSIMEWLGFTKLIDSKTGDVSFKFDHITGGTLIAGFLVGGAIVKALSKIFTASKNIGNLLLGKKGIAEGTGTITSLLSKLKNFKIKDFIAGIVTKLKTLLPIIGKVATVIASVIAIIKGGINIFKSFSVEEDKVTVASGKMALGFGEIVAGGTAIGALIGGPLGAAIGAVTGLLVGGITALVGYNNALNDLAKSKIFGDINISTEKWVELLGKSGIAVEDLSVKLDVFKTTIASLDSSFQSNIQQMGLYGVTFGTLAHQITDEDLPNIVNSINDASNSATEIVDTTTNYLLTGLSDFFAKGSSLTQQEQASILESIYNNGENQKSEIQDIQNKIIEIYSNAKAEGRGLNDQEYQDVANHLARLRQLEVGEVSYTNAELEFLHSSFNSKSMKLDEESYNNWKIARDKFENEQKEKIQKNYEIQYNLLTQTLGKQEGKQKEYEKAISDLNNQRLQEQSELEKALKKYDEDIYKDLANTYKDIQGETDKVSRRMRNTIEEVFKGIGVDKKDIISQFADAGEQAAKAFQKYFERRDYTLDFDMTDLGGGHKQVYASAMTNFKYASGGLPPVGQMFIANEQGPELVGQIGGKSFVANQNQMLGLIKDELATAKGGMTNATIIVQVGDEKIAEHTINKMEDMARANGKPFVIGG